MTISEKLKELALTNEYELAIDRIWLLEVLKQAAKLGAEAIEHIKGQGETAENINDWIDIKQQEAIAQIDSVIFNDEK